LFKGRSAPSRLSTSGSPRISSYLASRRHPNPITTTTSINLFRGPCSVWFKPPTLTCCTTFRRHSTIREAPCFSDAEAAWPAHFSEDLTTHRTSGVPSALEHHISERGSPSPHRVPSILLVIAALFLDDFRQNGTVGSLRDLSYDVSYAQQTCIVTCPGALTLGSNPFSQAAPDRTELFDTVDIPSLRVFAA
jgi:hypothetical protein